MANRRHSKRELQALRDKRQADRDAVFQFENPDQVLSTSQWARLVGISKDCAYQMLASPDGPRTLRLGVRRLGVRLRDHQQWLDRWTTKKSA